MKFKLIIFDFDGTLANSFPWLVSILNELAEKYRFKKINGEELELLRSYKAPQIMKRLGVSIWDAPKIGKDIKILMAQEIHRVALFDGVEGLIQELSSKGVRIAIVSSNTQTNVLRVLGKKMAEQIHFFECDVAINGKRASYRNILKQSGLRHKEVLCIGDELRDLEAAHKEKIAFGAVGWGYTSIEALKTHSPELIFSTIDEIRDVFLN